MPAPESEFFLGANKESGMNKENPEVSPIFENTFYSEIPENGGEQTTPQSEIPRRQEIVFTSELRSRSKTQVEEEVHLGRPQKETLNWFQRRIGKAKERAELLIKKAEEKGVLTKEDRKKIRLASKVWLKNGILCSTGLPIGIASIFLWRTLGNRLPLLCNLIPGALRLRNILVAEKRHGVKFGPWKVIDVLPCSPAGWAMPIEIAYTSGEFPLFLLTEIKEHYLKTPLTRARSAAQKVRNILRRQ